MKYVNKFGEFLSIGVRTTVIRSVVYLLRIIKMFHGLMNNPVFYELRFRHSFHSSVTKSAINPAHSLITEITCSLY